MGHPILLIPALFPCPQILPAIFRATSSPFFKSRGYMHRYLSRLSIRQSNKSSRILSTSRLCCFNSLLEYVGVRVHYTWKDLNFPKDVSRSSINCYEAVKKYRFFVYFCYSTHRLLVFVPFKVLLSPLHILVPTVFPFRNAVLESFF